MTETPGQHFYARQVAFLEAADVEGLMSQYHDDARLINLDFVVEGKAALRTHMTNYLKNLGFIKLKSTDKFMETDDSIYFEATVTTAGGEARVYDVFLLRDGQADRHFSGLISFTPAQ